MTQPAMSRLDNTVLLDDDEWALDWPETEGEDSYDGLSSLRSVRKPDANAGHG